MEIIEFCDLLKPNFETYERYVIISTLKTRK